MNINDEDIDLGLLLGSRNHPIQTRLSTSSGAGVNANLSLDMTFAASDPLSELVWSPQNGLSLKRTNPSSAEKNPFLLWNGGPNGNGLSTSLTIRSKGNGDDNENLTASQIMVRGDTGFCDKSTMVGSCRNSSNPELEASKGQENGGIRVEEVGPLDAREEGYMENNGEEIYSSSLKVQLADASVSSQKNGGKNCLTDGTDNCKDDVAMNENMCCELIGETGCYQNASNGIDDGSSDIKKSAVAFHSEHRNTKISEALFSSQSSQPELEPFRKGTSGQMYENKVQMPIQATPLMKLEFSAENDINATETCAVGETRIAKENSLSVERSPTNSRMRLYMEKRKEKAVSDGGMYPRLSNDESMESCSSARLFSSGIKRKNFNQEMMVGSKRMKKHNEGSFGSTALVGPDSSFMNWIKNMVKGVSNSYGENSSLAVTVIRPCDVHTKTHHEVSALNGDSRSPNTGFQSVFKSSYRNERLSDTGLKEENHAIEESKAIILAVKAQTANSCERKIEDSCKQLTASNKEANTDMSENTALQRYKPWLFSADYLESGFQENKASEKPVYNGEKGNTSLNSPLEISRPEKDSPSTSLWITRLYNRTLNIQNGSRTSQTADKLVSEFATKNLEIKDVFSVDLRSPEACAEVKICASKKETFEFSVKAEASLDFNSITKLDPILPPTRRSSTEEMAAVFSRRLDALRNIYYTIGKD